MSARTIGSRLSVCALLAVIAVASGCGAGPSDRPIVAIKQHSSGSGEPSGAGDHPIPQIKAPGKDLAWRDCTRPIKSLYGLGDGPPGLSLQCGDITIPVDPKADDGNEIKLGLLRATNAKTPKNGIPVVFTTGSDRASTAALGSLATGKFQAILDKHPIVAIDRRAIGNSDPVDCLAKQRPQIFDLAQFSAPPEQQADELARISQDATLACKDAVGPHELAYDSTHAADDIEALRAAWRVPALAIIGSGNGAWVALSYAGQHPDHVGRLVLDSAPAIGLDSTTLTEQRVQGAEASLKSWAATCAAVNCALGPDPVGAINGLLAKARSGALANLSANSLLLTLSGIFSSPRSDTAEQIVPLADALAAADRGDFGALTAFAVREAAQTASDGQFLARCSDGQGWPAAGRTTQLMTEWAEKYPTFGRETALSLAMCSAWPAVFAPPALNQIFAPVLALSAKSDPLTGPDDISTVTGAIGAAGGISASLKWLGSGHLAIAHSDCAQQAVVKYLESAKLPVNGTVCPA